ncbi:hypothetical protein [Acetobacterium sp.]|uniref:hypothetical protein n=1 Tax=Acetobacterium sp. TaxID=1872094 RepID=UPI002F3F28FF
MKQLLYEELSNTLVDEQLMGFQELSAKLSDMASSLNSMNTSDSTIDRVYEIFFLT